MRFSRRAIQEVLPTGGENWDIIRHASEYLLAEALRRLKDRIYLGERLTPQLLATSISELGYYKIPDKKLLEPVDVVTDSEDDSDETYSPSETPSDAEDYSTTDLDEEVDEPGSGTGTPEQERGSSPAPSTVAASLSPPRAGPASPSKDVTDVKPHIAVSNIPVGEQGSSKSNPILLSTSDSDEGSGLPVPGKPISGEVLRKLLKDPRLQPRVPCLCRSPAPKRHRRDRSPTPPYSGKGKGRGKSSGK